LIDAYLSQRQAQAVADATSFLSAIKKVLTNRLGEYVELLEEVERHYADPHPKKVLREVAWAELQEGSHKCINSSHHLWLHNVTYKMKKDEIAKPGKYPRMIGDLGVAASLQGFRATYLLKKAMAAGPMQYRSATFLFVATPEATTLESVFSQLINPPTKYYFVFFSDDACISVRTPTGVHCFNMDIKWCDASHGPGIFQALIDISPDNLKKDVITLVEQCKLPIVVFDQNDRSRRVKLRPRNPRLYSGSTITTFINNLANILILKTIVDEQAVTAKQIVDAATHTGYAVTLEPCKVIQDIQFLKHSPVVDTTGRLRAMLNLGVMFRSFGICKGDLPGSGDWRLRASTFCYAVLQGMYPRVSFRMRDLLLTNLKIDLKLLPKMQDKVFLEMHQGCVPDQEYTVLEEQLAIRYRLSSHEVALMTELFGNLTVGQAIGHEVFGRVLQKDYGLGVQNQVSSD